MPYDNAESLAFVKDLLKDKQVKVYVSKSVKGCVTVGLSSVAGALIFGPVGALIGGVISGVAMRDRTYTMSEFIDILEYNQRTALVGAVESIATRLKAADIAALSSKLMNDQDMQNKIVEELMDFIYRNMQVRVS